jgi:hypothetical protein
MTPFLRVSPEQDPVDNKNIASATENPECKVMEDIESSSLRGGDRPLKRSVMEYGVLCFPCRVGLSFLSCHRFYEGAQSQAH